MRITSLLDLEVRREGSDETSTRRIRNECLHGLESGDYVVVGSFRLTAEGGSVQMGTSKGVYGFGGTGRT